MVIVPGNSPYGTWAVGIACGNTKPLLALRENFIGIVPAK